MMPLNFNSKQDFNKITTNTTGSGSVSVNTSNKSFEVLTNDATSRAYTQLRLHDLQIGDLIEIVYEVEGEGQLDLALTRVSEDGTSLSQDWKESIDISGNKKGKIIFYAKGNGIYEIIIGALYGAVLDASLKNVTYTVKSITSYYKQKFVDNLMCTLQKKASGWELRSDLSRNTCTVSELDANTLYVNFSESVKDAPSIALIQQEWYEKSYQYIPKVSANYVKTAQIRFYDALDNSLVPLASVANYTLVRLLIV